MHVNCFFLLQIASPSSVYGRLWKKRHFAGGAFDKIEKAMYGKVPGVAIGDKTGMTNTVNSRFPGVCNWASLKETFFPAYFGIALPNNSAYTVHFSAE